MSSTKNLTFDEAKRLSILKWEWLLEKSEQTRVYKKMLEKRLPLEITSLMNYCGFCELYVRKDCKNCPLNLHLGSKGSIQCTATTHPYSVWLYDQTKANATAVLDMVQKATPLEPWYIKAMRWVLVQFD